MADGRDEATQAFENLRAEMTLVRRAVERLTAERAELPDMPDYSETLGVIAANITATAQRVDVLVNSPALALTPHEIGQQILETATASRQEDRRAIAAARQTIEEVATRLGRQLESHVMADEQRRRVQHVRLSTGLIALMAGTFLWAIFAGPLARAMPASWLWPEWMAARTLRMPMWEGGQRLMRAASPGAFRGIVDGNRLVVTNRKALEACRKQAAKAKKTVHCSIDVRMRE
jgi:hypothetical protein